MMRTLVLLLLLLGGCAKLPEATVKALETLQTQLEQQRIVTMPLLKATCDTVMLGCDTRPCSALERCHEAQRRFRDLLLLANAFLKQLLSWLGAS